MKVLNEELRRISTPPHPERRRLDRDQIEYYDVFLSFVSADRLSARKLRAQIIQYNPKLRIFLDEVDLVGKPVEATLEAKLWNCGTIVPIISKNTRREITEGMSLEISLSRMRSKIDNLVIWVVATCEHDADQSPAPGMSSEPRDCQWLGSEALTRNSNGESVTMQQHLGGSFMVVLWENVCSRDMRPKRAWLQALDQRSAEQNRKRQSGSR